MMERHNTELFEQGVSGRPLCRACEEAIGMTREQVRALAEKLRMDETQLIAPDDVYARRLDACEACGALLGGATCAHCGCIVPLRAMQLARGCPHPEGPRW